MRRHSIAVLPGDGIGKEVAPAAMRVLQEAARRYGFVLDETTYMWNCDYYKEHGSMMPPDGLDQLRRHDAIFLGAIGNPAIVPDHISLRQSLTGIFHLRCFPTISPKWLGKRVSSRPGARMFM